MTESAPPPEEGPPFPIEAVQMCAANAARLYEDSQNVSDPTRLALLELTIEEVAKGYWLLFKVQARTPPVEVALPAQGAPTPSTLNHPASVVRWHMTANEFVQLQGLTTRFQDVLSHDQFEPLFRRHEVKLELMNYLISMFRIVLPVLRRSGFSENALKKVMPFLNTDNLRESSDGEEQSVLDLLDNFDEDSFRTLARLKNESLYVGYSEKARAFTLPSANIAAGEALDSLAELMVIMLKGDIENYLSLKEQEPEHSQ